MTRLTGLLVVAVSALGVHPAAAQTLMSIEDLRRELAAGDVITVARADGPPLSGRLTRFGAGDLDLRLLGGSSRSGGGAPDLTIPFETIRALDRPRDPTRNGAWLGAAIGAGAGAAMFGIALAVDRNEIDEWAGPYLGVAAACTGLGALIGWAIDAAASKPHIRYEVHAPGKVSVGVALRYAKPGGIVVEASLSR